jgi:hypothetical protein
MSRKRQLTLAAALVVATPYNSQATPLTTAARIPSIPAKIASTLMIPPRIFAENAITQPMIPKSNAIIARRNPQNAPTMKLAIAATIAMMDGMLNFGGEAVCPSMARS